VLVLIGIGFLAGIITAISPCVLPVLPIVLAGGASGDRTRPYKIVAGLVTMFVVSILFATYILRKLGLPEDLLRDIAIVLLFAVAATLVFPQVGQLVERALAPLGRRRARRIDSGFLLGAALGFAFVPCGGPVLAYVSAQAASLDLGFRTIALAVAYALGASTVLLAIAIGGQRVAAPLRMRSVKLRSALGVVVAASAVALAFNLDTKLQTALPDWTSFLQEHTEQSAYARGKLYGKPRFEPAASSEMGLADYGLAPALTGGGRWFNSPPLTMERLRGKVVLIDFWTYSCINCLRTLPHLEAWDARYRKAGLVIVGVHSPEFAFEHRASNVAAAIDRLGVRYPVVQDNDFAIWNAYANQYWPAEYLIDRRGHVRRAHFGEGKYDESERAIRALLLERPGTRLGAAASVRDATPTTPLTPESYLGYERIDRLAGTPVRTGVPATYVLPRTLEQNFLAFGGRWTIENERAVARTDARLRLHFYAKKVFLVLSGTGRVQVLVDGRRVRTVRVAGARLYTLVDSPHLLDALLELRFTPDVAGYAFTFG
jgi:cytochrome c biogenesis protein CcdA/thiol-disulfide isomerase/thioredoxin